MPTPPVRDAAFPWLSGPRARSWLLGARVACVALLAAGLVLGGVGAAGRLLATLVFACAVLGRLAAGNGASRVLRIWLAGLLIGPWLAIALGNAALIDRLVLVGQGQAGFASLLAGDVLAVLLCWPVVLAAATRSREA